jgi:hypothetical protein
LREKIVELRLRHFQHFCNRNRHVFLLLLDAN